MDASCRSSSVARTEAANVEAVAIRLDAQIDEGVDPSKLSTFRRFADCGSEGVRASSRNLAPAYVWPMHRIDPVAHVWLRSSSESGRELAASRDVRLSDEAAARVLAAGL